jgi:hypothetical protein
MNETGLRFSNAAGGDLYAAPDATAATTIISARQSTPNTARRCDAVKSLGGLVWLMRLSSVTAEAEASARRTP